MLFKVLGMGLNSSFKDMEEQWPGWYYSKEGAALKQWRHLNRLIG